MIIDNNTIYLALISAVTLLVIFFVFKKDVESDEEADTNVFTLEYLSGKLKTIFNEILNQNLAELYISRKSLEKRKEQKERLSQAIRSSAEGYLGEREYLKDYIKDLIQSKLKISEETIDFVIPYEDTALLTELDKFEILLQECKKDYGLDAFGVLNKTCKFDQEKQNEKGLYYEVTKEDINKSYLYIKPVLTYVIKLEVLAQRLFQLTFGFGVIDELVYQKSIDSILGGTSGVTEEQYNYMEEIMKSQDITIEKSYNSIWIVLGGKPVRLSFLGFESREELIRVCKNLYRYDNVGHLTSSSGYKLSYLRNGSRVVVTRPKFTAGWSFFIRKFESSKGMDIHTLVKGDNNEVVIKYVEWIVKGMLNIIISGDMGSGKTTFLKEILKYLDQRYEIRTFEPEFELWLNHLYTGLNIVPFRKTEDVSIIEAINLGKKTEAMIMLLGEINDAAQANAFITLTQSGTKCTMATCHTNSPSNMVDYFRNATLSKEGIFTNEMTAEEQVANAIDLDIHWEKSPDGIRYISYIAEIVPLPRTTVRTGDSLKDIAMNLGVLARRRAFETREIIIYEKGKYVFKNTLSENSIQKIIKNLGNEDRENFLLFHAKVGGVG
ncbi:MAG: ATPase, T2SS/T4P/T4SS family [Mobilitalea sp.]